MMGIKDQEPILGCKSNFLSLDKVRLIQHGTYICIVNIWKKYALFGMIHFHGWFFEYCLFLTYIFLCSQIILSFNCGRVFHQFEKIDEFKMLYSWKGFLFAIVQYYAPTCIKIGETS